MGLGPARYSQTSTGALMSYIDLTFYPTQALIIHGCYRYYFHRMNPSPGCQMLLLLISSEHGQTYRVHLFSMRAKPGDNQPSEFSSKIEPFDFRTSRTGFLGLRSSNIPVYNKDVAQYFRIVEVVIRGGNVFIQMVEDIFKEKDERFRKVEKKLHA